MYTDGKAAWISELLHGSIYRPIIYRSKEINIFRILINITQMKNTDIWRMNTDGKDYHAWM